MQAANSHKDEEERKKRRKTQFSSEEDKRYHRQVDEVAGNDQHAAVTALAEKGAHAGVGQDVLGLDGLTRLTHGKPPR